MRQNDPNKIDLALGMLAHGYRHGADGFNRNIAAWLLSENKSLQKEIVQDIADCSAVSLEVANKYRLHNYLWCGMDLYLLKKCSDFPVKLARINLSSYSKEVSNLLSLGLVLDSNEIQRMVNYFFSIFKPLFFTSEIGLVKIWKNFMAGLPEKDKIDREKTLSLFNKIYLLFEKRWEDILTAVIRNTSLNLGKFL